MIAQPVVALSLYLGVHIAWDGVDTVVVAAGVSSLRPLLEIAGVQHPGEEPKLQDVQRTLDVSNAAIRGNFSGPLVSAVSLVRRI